MSNLIDKVKKRLKELNIKYDYVSLSDRPDKKIKIVIDGRIIHFGAKNSISFLEGASKRKRDSYIARHSKIMLKDGTRAIDKLYSPAWMSKNILWS
jgi:peptidase E